MLGDINKTRGFNTNSLLALQLDEPNIIGTILLLLLHKLVMFVMYLTLYLKIKLNLASQGNLVNWDVYDLSGGAIIDSTAKFPFIEARNSFLNSLTSATFNLGDAIANELNDLSGGAVDLSNGTIASSGRAASSYWVYQLFRSVINNNYNDVSGSIIASPNSAESSIKIADLFSAMGTSSWGFPGWQGTQLKSDVSGGSIFTFTLTMGDFFLIKFCVDSTNS